ncbi:ABC transporter ATP-binding protein [Azospirillum sp.]|uniref:energy-coupling factor ABC transporter ATP-binding protein n=1 Tax=Azospirillum sp. TaxID=34012 RepID=UPI002D302141|nr:ABC transporter ATP-binding protein [Azospirillum sp.]HYD71227.1 ABC transporter ATP-binding protein [Azospirillum sp.]
MIELREVSHSFGERPVLRDVTLTLAERRIGVVGANGSGKSTFARLLNGLLLPGRGTVLVDGIDTRRDARAVRRRVGFVFQDPDVQIVYPTVEEDLAFGLKNLRLDKAEVARRVDAALDRFGLAAQRRQSAHVLSGGEKQLLAIAGVLAMEPATVVFDEPTTLLDLRNRRRIAAAIRDLPQQAIVVTHDLDLLADFDRVVALDEGKVMADGAPAAVIDAYVRRMG